MADEKQNEKDYPNPVLEYYKKFSRSKELPKYFRGSIDLSTEPIQANENTEPEYLTKASDSVKDIQLSNVVKKIKRSDKINDLNNASDVIDVDIRIELEGSSKTKYMNDNKLVDAETATDMDNIRVPSPTSSVTSNRKLEWDNGADIGYENTETNLHKSLSLPTLSTLEKVALHQQFCRQSPDGKPADTSQNKINFSKNETTSTSETSLECDAGKKYISTTSSSFRKSPTYTTSSSSPKDDNNRINSFKFISKYSSDNEPNNQDVGNPIAESTPVVSTKWPSIKKLKKLTKIKDSTKQNQVLPNSSNSSNENGITYKQTEHNYDVNKLKEPTIKYKSQKEMKLCISKPVAVECLGDIQSQNKLIQTSLPKNTSAAVQTENETMKTIEKEHYQNPNYVERQNVIYLQHLEQEENEGEVTNSNSFEFIAGEQLQPADEIIKSNSSSTGTKSSRSEDFPTKLQKSQCNSNLLQNNGTETTVSSSAHSSARNSPLTNLLSTKHSNNLIQDVERSFDLLQQLLKSKKYDENTKKFYLKKVVKKIIKNKYNDDSSVSSNNNEQSIGIQTERSNEILERLHQNLPWEPVNSNNCQSKPILSKSSDDSVQKNSKNTQKDNHSIKQNEDKLKHRVKESKESQQVNEVNAIFETNDIGNNKSNEEELDVDKSKEDLIKPTYDKINKPRHLLFTITSNHLLENAKLSSEKNTVNSDPSTINEMHVSSSTSSLLKKTSKSSRDSTEEKKSWRDDKTLSEKLLEEKLSKFTENVCGDNNRLPSLTKIKKESQLNWINNEINHLHNLRKILEGNQEEIRKVLTDKPCESFKPAQKSTAVYVITTERTSSKNKCHCPSTSDKTTQNTNEINMRIGSETYKLKKCTCPANIRYLCKCPHKELVKSKTQVVTTKNTSDDSIIRSISSDSSQQKKAKASSYDDLPATHCIQRPNKIVCPLKPRTPSTKDSDPQSDYKETGSQKMKDKNSNDSKKCDCDSVDVDNDLIASGSNQLKKYQVIVEDDDAYENINTVDEKEDKRTKKSNDPIVIVLKIKNNDKDDDDGYPSSTSTTSSSSSYNVKSLCPCCKKFFIPKPSLSIFNELFSETSNLCQHCCRGSGKNSDCYMHPNQSCNCYTYVNTKTINDIKKTVKDLDELERQRSACTCNLDIGKSKNKKQCPLCSCKLKKPTSIAYTLNLISEDFKTSARRNQKTKQKSMEEVTIKIPCPNLGKKKKRNVSDEESEEESKENYNKNQEKARRKRKPKKKRKPCTLQDYLSENRPDFVKAAEERRRCMIELAYLRAKRIEKYKRLLALTSGIPMQNQNFNTKTKGMYTTKEMKEITAKTYKKLPEVQAKKANMKNQQIVKANKLITNIFNEKVRKNVLCGRKDFSTSVSVVNL